MIHGSLARFISIQLLLGFPSPGILTLDCPTVSLLQGARLISGIFWQANGLFVPLLASLLD
jgi:hypothetical protein